MDDMEMPGVDASIASLVGPFQNIMSFFTHIRSAKRPTPELQERMVSIGILHLRFSRWGAAINLCDKITNLKDLHAAVQEWGDVSRAKTKLASIANELERFSTRTRGRSSWEGVASSMTSGVLIQEIRQLADSRQCKAKTLRKVVLYLIFEKICHRSFRRQCKLGAAKVNWVFCEADEDDLDTLAIRLSRLIGELEGLIPGKNSIITSCYDKELTWLLPEAPSGSQQLSQLIPAMRRFDARFERARRRREEGASPRVPQLREDGFL
jgi:hypothetical protein